MSDFGINLLSSFISSPEICVIHKFTVLTTVYVNQRSSFLVHDLFFCIHFIFDYLTSNEW